jgi:hypothetical protein
MFKTPARIRHSRLMVTGTRAAGTRVPADAGTRSRLAVQRGPGGGG